MTKNIKRLFVAFILSAGCFYGVEYWYRTLDLGLNISSQQKTVARLVRHNNEVQRKPVTRLIWEVISNNENLFPGESIRTTSTSDATIFFIASGTTVELEPNSQVIIQGDENQISLNFVKGNLFVKQDDSNSNGSASIKLKTANGEIDLKKANLSLSQTDKGVDLEVYSGKANLTKDGKTIQVDANSGKKKAFFKLNSPLPHLPAFVSPAKKEPVSFQWSKTPAGYKVYIERGQRRSQLTRYTASFALGDTGELKLPTKTGKLFWRAVAVPNDPKLETQYSKTIYTQVIAKAPPILLQPEKDKTLVLIDKKELTYKWTTRSKITKDLILEVARDPGLRSKVFQKRLGKKLNSLTVPVSEPGAYYWRITGFMKIKKKLEPVSSPVQKYQVSFNAPLIPPVLKSPLANQSLSFLQASQNGTIFTWEPVNGIEHYRIRLTKLGTEGADNPNDKVLKKDLSSSIFTWKNLAPGKYSYYITSINKSEQESKPSEQRIFSIADIPRIEWTSGPKRTRYQYATATPSVSLSWKANIKNSSSWRIRYSNSEDFIETAEWTNLQTNQLKTPLDSAGDWNFQVEALNSLGQTIAQSDVKIVLIKERPLLRAPAYAQQTPSVISSSRRGILKVEWNRVAKAKNYHLQITDEAGTIIQNQSSSTTNATFKGLSPGKYQISIKSVDKYERPGPSGEAKDIVVPDGSNIAAPKLKRINVK